MLDPKCSKFLKDRDVPLDEPEKLADEDALKFRDLFIQSKVSKAHRACTKQMDTLYEFLIDIATKRVSIDKPSVKIDQIAPKVVLVDLPEGINVDDWSETVKKPPAEEGGQEVEEVIEHKKNTNEQAVIILKVPQVEEEQEVPAEVTGEDGEQKTETIKKLVDEDQDQKAVVIQGRDVSGVKVVEAR